MAIEKNEGLKVIQELTDRAVTELRDSDYRTLYDNIQTTAFQSGLNVCIPAKNGKIAIAQRAVRKN